MPPEDIQSDADVELNKASTNLGKVRYRPYDEYTVRDPKDGEYRLIEVWDPAKYMGQPAGAANASLSALFIKDFAIPTEGFSPVSLTHAKFIFYTFRITPGL